MNYKTMLIGVLCQVLLTVGILAFLKKIEPKIPTPATEEPVTKYGKSTLIKTASALVIVAWISLIGLISGLIVEITIKNPSVFLFFLPILLFAGLSYGSICPFLKCESCRRAITVQWVTAPPFSKKMWFIEGWASIILQVVLLKRFTCMYCGKDYSVE